MKKIFFLLLPLISFELLGQEIADSTITDIAKFNCECQDTVNLKKSNQEIQKLLQNCFIKSLVVHLNKGTIDQSYLNEKKKLNALQTQVFEKLVNCDKTVKILQRLNNIPIPIDSVPKALFISESFFQKHGLKKGQVNKEFIVWNSDTNQHIQRVVDIRWVFENNEEAIAFHKAKLVENSENGKEIKFNSTLEGASEVRVFKESKEMEKMINMLNLPQKQHYFLFVVDNVVFKVFVATDKSLHAEDVKFIAQEAINQKKKQ